MSARPGTVESTPSHPSVEMPLSSPTMVEVEHKRSPSKSFEMALDELRVLPHGRYVEAYVWNSRVFLRVCTSMFRPREHREQLALVPIHITEHARGTYTIWSV